MWPVLQCAVPLLPPCTGRLDDPCAPLVLADGMVQWNTAIFQLDWNNFQFAILGPNGLTEIRNAAQARIRGLESDVTIRPDDHLSIGAGVTILDAKLTDNYCGETDAQGVPITTCAATAARAGSGSPA